MLSGWVARACGMPLARLVIGSNANDILPRLVAGGSMEMRDVVPTLSPSMDIQVSSNLERLLFELYGRDPERTASELAGFTGSGSLTLGRPERDALGELFEASALDDDATLAAMRREHERSGLLLDPHTAVGLAAGRARSGGRDAPLVALATAHPAKFPDAVERATGIAPALPPALADLHELPERSERVARDSEAVKRLVLSPASRASRASESSAARDGPAGFRAGPASPPGGSCKSKTPRRAQGARDGATAPEIHREPRRVPASSPAGASTYTPTVGSCSRSSPGTATSSSTPKTTPTDQ